jgi:hypothetical protein
MFRAGTREAEMDKKAFKLAARLSAIEYMIADLFKKIYAMNGTPYKEVAKDHELLRKHLRKMSLPIPDPAMSDLTAGEMMDAFEKLLEKIEIAVQRR